MTNAITDVPGIKIGQAQDLEKITGCTVVLCEEGAVAGVDQRGGGPGTRETDALKPTNMIEQVHGIMLAGGSAFGLDAASGAMRFLQEKNIGYNTGVAKVPIIPAAILFDLGIGDAKAFPDATMGYAACQNASDTAPDEGNVGAGTGATVGKLLGAGQATKAGIGTASMEIGGGIIVGAIIAVNALGDVIDPATNEIIAGTRSIQKGPMKIGEGRIFANSLTVMQSLLGRTALGMASRQNTVIGVVATNAKLNKSQATRVAQMAQNGVVRAIRPANTMFDGDTMFALSIGKKKADVNLIGAFAAQVVAQAILNGVTAAQSMGGVPSIHDL